MGWLRMLHVKGRSTLVSMDMVIQNYSRCKLVCSALQGGPQPSCPAPPGRATAPNPFNRKQQDQSQIQTKQNPTPNKVPPLSFRGAPANTANFSSSSKQSRFAWRTIPGLVFRCLTSFLKVQSTSANSSQRQAGCWKLLLGKGQGCKGHAGG